MNIKPIRTKKEHKAALARVYELMEAEPADGTPELDELELLAMVVEEYEDEHTPVLPPAPLEAIKFRVEQLGMTDLDLDRILGSRQRRSEVFRGTRKLSLGMIRMLHKELNIPAETLIKEYTVNPRKRTVRTRVRR